MGTAFDAFWIEVHHHAADFTAGERDDGHGTGARDPTDPPDVRWGRQGRRHAACVALANTSRSGTVLGSLAPTHPVSSALLLSACSGAFAVGWHQKSLFADNEVGRS